MTLIKTIPTAYHLISLGDQVLFQSAVHSHQSLAMNKTVLMNAIASLAASQSGLGKDPVPAPVQTGMANGLAEQKQDALKQQQALEERDLALQEIQRQWSDKEQDLQQRHEQLLHEREQLAHASEKSAQMISEHHAALQQLAEGLEARERESVRLADVLQQENSRAEALSALLDTRLAQLQQRERQLQRRVLALHEDLKQLRKAKDRFSGIVKRFNLNVKLGSDPLTNTVKHQEEGT